jgi:Swt1-like HEPN
MSSVDQTYNFVLRGLLAEEALDRAGRRKAISSQFAELQEVARIVGLDNLDEEDVAAARIMAVVYTAIAAFENSVRRLISKTLLESVGEDWWSQCVSERIRSAAQTRMDEEEKVRWHAQRGADPVQYTMLPNLLNIIRQNFAHFEPFVHNVDWAASIFDPIERSRNVIMHSGTLGPRDIARVGTLISDWTRQVSA